MNSERRRRLVQWLAFAAIIVAGYIGLTGEIRTKGSAATERQIICILMIVVGFVIWLMTGRQN